MFIASAFHHGELICPSICHFEMLLCWRKRTRWAFLKIEWSSSLCHDSLYIVVRFFLWFVKFLYFSMGFRSELRDSWQFIYWACILHSEAGWSFFRLLVEVLSVERMHLKIVSAFGYSKAIVPISTLCPNWSCVAMFPSMKLLFRRFWSFFNFKTDMLRFTLKAFFYYLVLFRDTLSLRKSSARNSRGFVYPRCLAIFFLDQTAVISSFAQSIVTLIFRYLCHFKYF